ncbi:nucleobindin-2-like isoform X2 [Varroa destructor]|uniref:EF-hand domain-containing protein n=1 Tax=Varroa destructor TaxID=109461 RepID=A0A7M7KMF1_VARDE|nr:nucleobindin-2-like isoform X2 [Varroa destructor]
MVKGHRRTTALFAQIIMGSEKRASYKKRFFGGFLVVSAILGTIVCPPVDPNSNKVPAQNTGTPHNVNNETDPAFNLEYGRYLAEVVKILETDKEFAKKLENVSEADIRNGQIATHLDLVDHKVRTKLDELKRIEVDRLRKLTQKKNELEHGVYRDGRLWRSVPKKGLDRDKLINDHLDHDNQHTFEIEDLKKLILAATRDLEKLDEARKAEFKQYEMEKEFEFQQGLKNMTEDQKNIEQKKHEDEKHRKHPQAHHPGSKAQLEQVWEEEDHMEKQDFDPKTFFAMHDLNGDGVLDEQEVEAILQLEAKKMYMSDPQNPGDPRRQTEMEEEVNRMREHVFKEVDKDKDGLISRQEFLDMTRTQEFEQDNGWKGLDEQQIYTQEELQRFMQMREQQMQMAMAQGYGYHPGDPPNVQYHPGYGAPQGPPHGYQQAIPQMGYPQGQRVAYMPQGVAQVNPTMGQQVYQQHGDYGQPPQALPSMGHQGINPQMPVAAPVGHQMNPNSYQQLPQHPPQGLPPPKVTVGNALAAAPQPNQVQNNINEQLLPTQHQSQQYNQGGAQHYNAPSQQFNTASSSRQHQQQQQQQQQQQGQLNQVRQQQQQLNQQASSQQQAFQQPHIQANANIQQQQQQQAQFKPVNPPVLPNQVSARS